MASGINSNFFFPGVQQILGRNPGLGAPDLGGSNGNSLGEVAQRVALGNEKLGDAWNGIAGGPGRDAATPNQGGQQSSASSPAIQGLQQLYGGSSKEDGAGLDAETRELLKKRTDLTAKDFQELKGELRVAFPSPAMQDVAYKKALETLGEGGTSAKPQELGRLMHEMISATGKKNGASAALDMFDKSKDLLKGGKSVEDIGSLVKSAQAIGGGDGKPDNVARSFEMAAKTVSERKDLKAQDVAQVGHVIANRFPGKDPKERMDAFQTGTQMLGQSAGMNAKGIDAMLARGQAQGLKGEKLLKSFQTQGQAVREGALNTFAAGDAGNKSLSFGKDGSLNRERTSMQSKPDQKMTTLGKEPSRETRGAGNQPGVGQGQSRPGQGETAPTPQRERTSAPGRVL